MNILLTGVSTGIGLTTAKLLLECGHRVFGTVRKLSDAEHLSQHPAFSALKMDVTDRESIRSAIATIKASNVPLHAVINNAGVAISGPLETLAEEDYRWQLEVNVFGVMAVCQESLPLLHAAREAGETNVKIINVSSVSGHLANPFTSMYSASKFALMAITDGMRRELMPFGIDVVSISPGAVKTPIWKKAETQTKAYVGTRYEFLLEKLIPYVRNAAAGGVAPEAVAELLLNTLVQDRPKTDQLIMNKAWMVRLVKLLPARIVDKLTARNLASNKRYS
ncbi:MAG: SDR family NAD(P)-dependent oxidoreductase [Bacteroidota bacterium]